MAVHPVTNIKQFTRWEKEYAVLKGRGKMKRGQPLKFKSVEDLENSIEDYFIECEAKERPLTISGLAICLGTNRQTLLNYEDKDEYFDTIKTAKNIIENYAEEQLFTNSKTGGIIFNLVNNWGWKNKTESEIKHQVEKIDGFKYVVPNDSDSQSNT